MSEQVSIGTIDTRPALDVYHRDTGQATYTVLKLYPESRSLCVLQEYDDNATPGDEWHHHIETLAPAIRPDEDALREYLTSDAGQSLLSRVCDGHSIEWDGNNLVGRMTDDAEEAWSELEQAIDNLPESEWALWSTIDYLEMVDVDADATDEELATEAATIEAELPAEHVVLSGDVLDILREKREHAREWR